MLQIINAYIFFLLITAAADDTLISFVFFINNKLDISCHMKWQSYFL